MGLFTKRKSRATRRAEQGAQGQAAKLEAKLEAKNQTRRIKAEERAENKALRLGSRPNGTPTGPRVKVAEAQLKAAREGRLLSPTRVRRLLTVGRMLAPILVPLAYRAAMAARGVLDQRKADKLGVPVESGGPVLRARRAVVGTDRRGRTVRARGRREESGRRRDPAVRRRHERPPRRPVGRGDRGRTHAGEPASGRSYRDQRPARRHRRRSDGAPRRFLSGRPDGRVAGRRRRSADGGARRRGARHGFRRRARWSGIGLLLVLAVGLGAVVDASPRAVGPVRLVGLLAAGQLAGHLVLAAGAHHGHPADPGSLPGTLMLVRISPRCWPAASCWPSPIDSPARCPAPSGPAPALSSGPRTFPLAPCCRWPTIRCIAGCSSRRPSRTEVHRRCRRVDIHPKPLRDKKVHLPCLSF